MPLDEDWLNSLKVADLKEELHKYSLPVSGKKADLMARLKEHLLSLDAAGDGEAAAGEAAEAQAQEDEAKEEPTVEPDVKEEKPADEAPEEKEPAKVRYNLCERLSGDQPRMLCLRRAFQNYPRCCGFRAVVMRMRCPFVEGCFAFEPHRLSPVASWQDALIARVSDNMCA